MLQWHYNQKVETTQISHQLLMMNKVCYICKTEYYSTRKKSKTLICALIWMNVFHSKILCYIKSNTKDHIFIIRLGWEISRNS